MSQTLSRNEIGGPTPAASPVEGLDRNFGDAVEAGLHADTAVDVSIVLPFYNPGNRLRPTVEHVIGALTASGMTFEVITVSDGSTDGSPSTLEGLSELIVRQVSYPTNAGKGHALRTGFQIARGTYVGFIDADGDISPDFLTDFLDTLRDGAADIVIGTKRHRASAVHNSISRRIYSWGYQSLIRLLFSLDVTDTQVGIKLMDRRVLDDVLPLLRQDGFALDLELLVLAQSHGYNRIEEAPIRIEERSQSTISLRAIRRLLADTITIFWRSSVRHDLDHAPAREHTTRTTPNSVELRPSPAAS